MVTRALSGLVAVTLACSAAPIPYEDDELWGYRDRNGRTVVTAGYLVAGEFGPGGIAAVLDEEGWAYIDPTGTVMIRPYLFDNGPDPFCEGLARFRKDGLFGFFDETGRVVISPRFEWVEPFEEGSARYGKGCRFVPDGEHRRVECTGWGHVDRNGRPVTPRSPPP